MNKILVSALEPSANLHLKQVLNECKVKNEKCNIVGVFDKSLGEPVIDGNEFNVMGFLDVLPKIKLAKKAINELAELSKKCDKVLLIDAPSFNLRLAKKIKEVNPGVEIIYYILPKVWAWKKGRIKDVNRYVDKKAYIFPFEREIWTDGIYVGNPLLDEIKTFRDDKLYGNIAFLPGSRKSEIKNLMPVFRELIKHLPGNKILAVPEIYKDKLSEIYGDLSGFEIVYDAHEALLKSDFAYICSGTATLEAAIIGTPFVLMYKAREIEYIIAKMFVKLNYVGLANIIFEREGLGEFHKEYLQDFDIEKLINDFKNSSLKEFQKKSDKLKEILKHGSAKNVFKLLKL
ncbi:lipid-A-disaccharide synthase [Nautilia profundicola AmH]|uniref:Lipid-A-disaccharide synthase n=1 Tax=Nautilia profundicola (strain ATCC BAA-1463 / DSM 18972 / AmH) TaxID=598659 RepID=B9L820_NAUPA|nr:lipid-A-disaccharide synthase [Nautilia profundicola]ACM92981.1 lipid-A-disaccharide synthase [Nautilia profundicola AmH]